MQPSLLLTCLWTLPITISKLKVPLGLFFYQKSCFLNLLELWSVCLCIIWFITSALFRPWNTQNVKNCAQFCPGGIPTCLTLELDVCQVVLSREAMEWLRCSAGSFTSDLHSLEVPHLRFSPHSLYASWWITPVCVFMNRLFCTILSIPLTSSMLPALQYGYPIQHVSVCLNLLGSRSCGWLGHACMPAGQANVHVGMGLMATSRLNKGWALSAFPSGTDASLALVFLCGQMVQSKVWEMSDFEPSVFLLNLIEMAELQGKVLRKDDTPVLRVNTQILMQTGFKSHVGIVFLRNKANSVIAWLENDIGEAGFGFLILRLSLCIPINNVADRQF